jgi:hypothetical protein
MMTRNSTTVWPNTKPFDSILDRVQRIDDSVVLDGKEWDGHKTRTTRTATSRTTAWTQNKNNYNALEKGRSDVPTEPEKPNTKCRRQRWMVRHDVIECQLESLFRRASQNWEAEKNGYASSALQSDTQEPLFDAPQPYLCRANLPLDPPFRHHYLKDASEFVVGTVGTFSTCTMYCTSTYCMTVHSLHSPHSLCLGGAYPNQPSTSVSPPNIQSWCLAIATCIQ